MWVMAMAVAGCLFVIPTAAEIPIVQTMMLAGMGPAPALALLMTLPAVSLPSPDYAAQSVPSESLMADRGDGGSVWCDCRRAGAVVLI